MLEFIIFLAYSIICYGISNTIIYAHGPFHIFDHLHKIAERIHPQLNELISCAICFPWWIGFLLSALNVFLFPTLLFTPMSLVGLPSSLWYVTVFLDGAYASGSVWLIHTTQEAIERSWNGND